MNQLTNYKNENKVNSSLIQPYASQTKNTKHTKNAVNAINPGNLQMKIIRFVVIVMNTVKFH